MPVSSSMPERRFCRRGRAYDDAQRTDRGAAMAEEGPIGRVRGWIDAAARVVVLGGAGISTESGIPDFRGPQGVWTRDPAAERLATIAHYLADAEVRRAAWQARLASPACTAQPNRGHRALVDLERRGKLHALITQNVDGLHQAAGNSASKVIEVHGTLHRWMGWGCGRRAPIGDVLPAICAP
jgi:NAD-dependent deacetylase